MHGLLLLAEADIQILYDTPSLMGAVNFLFEPFGVVRLEGAFGVISIPEPLVNPLFALNVVERLRVDSLGDEVYLVLGQLLGTRSGGGREIHNSSI